MRNILIEFKFYKSIRKAFYIKRYELKAIFISIYNFQFKGI